MPETTSLTTLSGSPRTAIHTCELAQSLSRLLARSASHSPVMKPACALMALALVAACATAQTTVTVLPSLHECF